MKRRRRVRRKRTPISKVDRTAVFDKYGGYCAYCGIKLKVKGFHVDHFIAKARGGKDDMDNLMPACPPCNIAKRTFTINVFRSEIGKKVERLRRRNANFRTCERYGTVEVKVKPIVFYFEKGVK